MENSGLLRRLAAVLYDTLLLVALLMLATLPFVAVRGGEPVEAGSSPGYQLTLLAVIYLYFVGYWSRRGRTLGMQSWGLRVEGTDGQLPTVGAASIRFLVAIASWAVFGLGFLWQLRDPEQRSWHDIASGTRLRYYPRPRNSNGADN